MAMGFLGGAEGKESTCYVGDLGMITGLGRFPGGGHGNPFQYSCLENPQAKEPGTEESGGLQSQRVRHDCATKHSTALRRPARISINTRGKDTL